MSSIPQTTQVPASGGNSQRIIELTRVVRRLRTNNRIALGMIWIVATLVALLFIAIIILLLVQGIGYLFAPQFYSTGDAGIAAELFNTFYILTLAEVFLFPIALAAAIYMVEYARQGPVVTILHFAAETLAGVPSIVLGLFGALAFGTFAHLGTSRLTGALTLLCLNLPLALRLFEDALATVPRELREGGLALGATRWQTIRTVVLPSALPGIVTGLILSAGKIIGEAAALIFTMGSSNPPNLFSSPTTLFSPFVASDTLSIHIWYIKTAGAGSTSLTTPQETAIAAGSSALLILILLFINLVARGLSRYIQRRVTAA